MFPVKIVLLCSAIFVFADGKNWYPEKYSHSIHKRVDPDYWEDSPLENNFLPVESLSKQKFSISKNNELFSNPPSVYHKKYFPISGEYSMPQEVLKRYKRGEEIDLKLKNQKPKKYDSKGEKKTKLIIYPKFSKTKKF